MSLPTILEKLEQRLGLSEVQRRWAAVGNTKHLSMKIVLGSRFDVGLDSFMEALMGERKKIEEALGPGFVMNLPVA